MKSIRPPAVDALFYPGDQTELRNAVQSFLKPESDKNSLVEFRLDQLKALIVPHAGYIYSGSTAGIAYRLLKNAAGHFKRVLLMGPTHRVWVDGVAAPTVDFFQTPLGKIAVDQETIKSLQKRFEWLSARDDAHAQEHSLEVQLPFLQEVLGDFQLIPLAVGEVVPELLSELIQFFDNDPQTIIVISTDLSHFHDDETARKIDENTARIIENLEGNKLKSDFACGASPLRAALLNAKNNAWQVKRLGLCNSGDTSGDRQRVVGYGAWAMIKSN